MSLRSFRQYPARTVLTVAGVAIGVGAFLAIRLANQGAIAGFRASFDAVAGRAALQVTAFGEPLDEGFFPKVREVQGVRLASPILQVMAAAFPTGTETRKTAGKGQDGPGPGAPPGAPLLVLGIDILSEQTFRDYMFSADPADPSPSIEKVLQRLLSPTAIFVTDRFARRHGLKRGDPLVVLGPGRRRTLTVEGLLRSADGGSASPASALDGQVALMDIAAAQETFGRIGELDRIDILPEEGQSLDTLAERIRAVLPGDLTVGRPQRRSRQSEQLMSAFQLNLTILSYIALLVGIFIIYNTMSMNVIRRRHAWGVLRSLGAAPRGIFGLVLTEGAMLGVLGSGLGILLGTLMGRGALEAVGETVGNLYVPVGTAQLRLTPVEILIAVGAGTGCALLSSFLPAATAVKMSVRESLQRKDLIADRHIPARYTTLPGLVLLGFGGVMTRMEPVSGIPLFGYLAALAFVLGFALLTPLSVRIFSSIYRRFSRRSRSASAMLVDLKRSSGKNSVAIASLAIAMAMVVSVSLMVASFRSTMESWIGQRLRADLYVSPAVRFVGNLNAVLPEGIDRMAGRTAGVLAVGAFRSRRIAFQGSRVRLGAGNLRVARDHGGMRFLSGNRRSILDRAIDKKEVLVSEVFSTRFGLGTGDPITLRTARGPRIFRIAGIFYDYSTDGGLVIMDRSLYRRMWNDDRISTLAVYINPGESPGLVQETLAGSIGYRDGVTVFENRRLRRHVLNIFDQTFAITYALEGIAMVVAVLGFLKALLANVFERTREIGLLRAIGFDRRQVSRWVMGEAAAMAALANLQGLAAGGILAWILIFVINKQSFGWTIHPHWPPAWLGGYFLLTFSAAVLAALWPARSAAKIDIQEALRFE